MGKQRIAILGGGMAALTTAFEITNAVGWQDAYDITVYQLGWRLGGKGASGRNAEHHDRIEEHGLHILLGFYENAFRVLKQAYGELDRPAGAPLATWQDAFKPHNYVVLMESIGNEWKPWAMNFPPNTDEPGTGGVLPSPWAMIQMILGWLKQVFIDSVHLPNEHENLDAARAKAASRDHTGVLEELYELHEWLRERDKAHTSIDWRRDFVTVDLGVAAIKGMIEDGVVFHHDYFKLDTLDFRAWLSKYGAHDVSVNSAYISGMYDLGFSLPGQVGAGTALNGILRMCWTYKGAVMWKMQAGMGDTIFGPLYLVLENRGVKFEFFSRVDNLGLSSDSARVDTISIGRQMRVKGGEYNPLVPVKDLECWPSEPQYDQLERGAELKASGENLEDWWTAWPDAEQRVLRAAMVTGREVFGFFKQTATLAMPSSPGAGGEFTIDALAIPKFSPSSEAQTIRLLSMQPASGTSARGGTWIGIREAVTDVWGAIRKTSFAPGLRLTIDVIENMTEDLITGDVPMVFLKQFRAAGDASRACYQAVIEAPAHLQRWHGGGFTGAHDITITPADSHPIVAECGLAGSQLRADLGFWTQMDFVMQPGVVVAERR